MFFNMADLKLRVWDDEHRVYRDIVKIDFYRGTVLAKGMRCLMINDGIDIGLPVPDSTGNTIYTGDIVKDISSEHMGIIKFDGMRFYIEPRYEPKSLFDLLVLSRLVIIGNEKHNPEMLFDFE